ncbi:MAG: CotH kinase family protein [Paludibacteraceae bacterium]|nr:CotH kinase family protein [Paludibacteraceae bacterium]
MKSKILLVVLLFVSAVSYALTIPKGTIYFDNSKTAYQSVRFVYGSDTNAKTYVLEMKKDGNVWSVQIPNAVNNMYRFTFVGSAVRTGTFNQTFSNYKDSISNKLSLYRTATSSAQMNANDIFVPSSGDNWTQGTWMNIDTWRGQTTNPGQNTNPGTNTISQQLPVVYVTTTAPIESKDVYVTGTIYIDPLTTGYEALGTAQTPITAQFKGRGNWTWTGFDKKPYRIKMDVKQKVLGMPSNKHWCLMAAADDNLGFLRMPLGHMISEAIGLRWTPRLVPVELVLNNKYVGLYFMTEHVRVGSKRVNIEEQLEGETQADLITGGWLVEIDNYPTENNITFTEGNGQAIMVSLKEPEIISAEQRNYIVNQMLELNTALYEKTPQHIERILDMKEAAKYYLVQEIMGDCESYHGSCYLYKDRDSLGMVDKWKFGPVWDFGNSYRSYHHNGWIYERPQFAQYWIGQLATWPSFQKELSEQWWIYYHTKKDEVRAQLVEISKLITQAAKNDAVVWRNTLNYTDNTNMTEKTNSILEQYDWRIQWLYSKLGEGTKPPTTGDIQISTPEESTKKIMRDGQVVIIRNGVEYNILGKRVK